MDNKRSVNDPNNHYDEQVLKIALSVVLLCLDLGFYKMHKIESRTAAFIRLHWLFGM
jgi:hypothetical protein